MTIRSVRSSDSFGKKWRTFPTEFIKERKERRGREFRDDSCKKEVMQTVKESRINTVMMHRNQREFSESPDCLTVLRNRRL